MAGNIPLRVLLALLCLVVIFHPDVTYSIAAAAVVLPAVIFGVIRHRIVAPPRSPLAEQAQPAQ